MLKWLRSRRDDTPRVKGYEIKRQIFAGAFSNIYRAVHEENGADVALKILTKAGSRIASLLQRHRSTLWEGELLSVLDHPNIVKCVEFSKKPPYWIAMEFIESNLGQYVGRCNDGKEESELLNLLSQLTSALDYLHGKGLVHRDICLSNILVDEQANLKLIDFGLTVPVDTSVTRGRAGTPSYMAPEMIRKWTHTEMTDIYSFGVVMYELVTGIKPFKGTLREQRMTRSLNVHPPAPSTLQQFCSPDLEALLMKCMSKDPQDRWQSATELDSAMFVLRHNRKLA